MTEGADKRILTVGLGDRSYDIVIGDGVIAQAGALLRDFVRGERACVISDETVHRLHGLALAEALGNVGVRYDGFIIIPGEESKNVTQLSALYAWFADEGRLSREGLVIAFGGGVVGDLAGFAAATWMRGVRYVQVPTTLLAMVDSSVGGKTAINVPGGKNLVGAFHQPSLVIIDPTLMKTLPPRELNAGFAEVAKYGAIASEKLFARLESGGRESGLSGVIHECCSLKAEIVEDDEFDVGRRTLLNFGHTFGHAIEARHWFVKYNHGEAVAVGMSMAAAVGERLGVTEKGTAERVDALLSRLGLSSGESANGLIPYMKNDKKAREDGVTLVLLKRVGEAVTHRVTWPELEDALYG